MTDKDKAERDEELFEESLKEHGQLADEDAAELPSGATHRVVTGDDGKPEIRRERYSAF